MKLIKTLLAIFLLTVIINAQDDQIKNAVKEIIKNTDKGYSSANESIIIEAINLSDRILSMNPENEFAVYYKVYAKYRNFTFQLNSDKKDLIAKEIDACISSLAKIKGKAEWTSEVTALESFLYSFKLVVQPQEAPALAGKIGELIGTALGTNPENPRALVSKGVMSINTPEFFGGSVDRAIVELSKALELFEANKTREDLMPTWGMLDAYAWLGQAYQRKNNFDKAEETFKKGLAIDPEFGWIKNVLLPTLMKAKEKIKDQK